MPRVRPRWRQGDVRAGARQTSHRAVTRVLTPGSSVSGREQTTDTRKSDTGYPLRKGDCSWGEVTRSEKQNWNFQGKSI